MHILNLEIGEVAVLDGLTEHHAGVGGVHMAVCHIVILDNNHRVAVGFKEGTQAGNAGILILVEKELGAVAVLDVLNFHEVIGEDALAGSAGIQLGLGSHFGTCDHLAALKDLTHTFKDQHNALTACVHNAGLFQDGQQIGRILKGSLTGGADCSPQGGNIIRFAGAAGLSSQTGNGEDGAFGRLHNRLVSGFDAHLKCAGQIRGLSICLAGQCLGETAEQKARDNTGVSARTAQHGGGGRFAGLGHRAGIRHSAQFLDRSTDGHAHVGTGIAVRNWENIQLIHAGALVGNIVGAGKNGVAQNLTCNH